MAACSRSVLTDCNHIATKNRLSKNTFGQYTHCHDDTMAKQGHHRAAIEAGGCCLLLCVSGGCMRERRPCGRTPGVDDARCIGSRHTHGWAGASPEGARARTRSMIYLSACAAMANERRCAHCASLSPCARQAGNRHVCLDCTYLPQL